MNMQSSSQHLLKHILKNDHSAVIYFDLDASVTAAVFYKSLSKTKLTLFTLTITSIVVIFLYCISFQNAQLLVHADFKLSAVLSGASYLFYLCHYRLWATFESLRRGSAQTVIPLQWQEDCFKESSRAELWTFLCCLCEGMYHSKDAQEVRFYLSFAQLAAWKSSVC